MLRNDDEVRIRGGLRGGTHFIDSPVDGEPVLFVSHGSRSDLLAVGRADLAVIELDRRLINKTKVFYRIRYLGVLLAGAILAGTIKAAEGFQRFIDLAVGFDLSGTEIFMDVFQALFYQVLCKPPGKKPGGRTHGSGCA
ncbi:hypothetical protein D3C80_1693330 [compost metagenome]